uniref:Steroid dehydrogenase 4 n=1 Tax=Phascolarctos cinereus TaxID=38626 RepID=A0A6P5JX20_PHACI|nr:putative steroid dehydrogenase 4 [Phascolarctos cinereus]
MNSFSRAVAFKYQSSGVIIQTLTPMAVSSNLSHMPPTKFLVKSSDDFAREALDTVGVSNFTWGVFPTLCPRFVAMAPELQLQIHHPDSDVLLLSVQCIQKILKKLWEGGGLNWRPFVGGGVMTAAGGGKRGANRGVSSAWLIPLSCFLGSL